MESSGNGGFFMQPAADQSFRSGANPQSGVNLYQNYQEQ